ncbi:Pre-mRNA-processing factor 17 [Diplonema papillatum]|nr:Pre-mRNA-processing factor 17 [Diplonema papillatum]WGM50030.1 PRP17 [Diplonema papillatum]
MSNGVPPDDAAPAPLVGFKRPIVDLAPDVADEVDFAYLAPGTTEVRSNLLAEELYAPAAGPANPWKAADTSQRNTTLGFFEESAMNAYMFEEQQRSNDRVMFGDWKQKRAEKDPKRLRVEAKQAALQKADKKEGEPEVEVTKGGEVVSRVVGGKDMGTVALATAEEGELVEGHDMYYVEDKKGNKSRQVVALTPVFTRHIDETTLYDYQGRSVILEPPSVTVSNECYPPKKLVHTYLGHNKGVHVLRWVTAMGHMFLSGGQEGKVKLWNTLGNHELVQTYHGHFLGVKDINLSGNSATFLTCAHDRFIREWDTETGKVLGTYSNGALANVVKYHPDPDRPYIFFAGCSDNQLHQFDTRSGSIIRSYDQHLGAVNTCTFIDNNRKIVTTSDDKTVRVWEMDLPVTIKQVHDPGMHSMPTATDHPNGKCFGMQSMDNQILIYSSTESFQLNRRKRFSGHITAGYACEVGFSHDGKYVSSGNGDGELFIWSWGSCKIAKHYKCHDKVLISHLWHPTETSKLLTSSWDNTIKLWD